MSNDCALQSSFIDDLGRGNAGAQHTGLWSTPLSVRVKPRLTVAGKPRLLSHALSLRNPVPCPFTRPHPPSICRGSTRPEIGDTAVGAHSGSHSLSRRDDMTALCLEYHEFTEILKVIFAKGLARCGLVWCGDSRVGMSEAVKGLVRQKRGILLTDVTSPPL